MLPIDPMNVATDPNLIDSTKIIIPTVVEISDFLEPAGHNQICNSALSATYSPYLHTRQRCTDIPIVEWLLPHIDAKMPEILAQLHLIDFPKERIEAELWRCQEYDQWQQVIDNQSENTANYLLSVIYYCSPYPKDYQGGDLIIHGQEDVAVEPTPNKLVVFASSRPNTMSPVFGELYLIRIWYRMQSMQIPELTEELKQALLQNSPTEVQLS